MIVLPEAEEFISTVPDEWLNVPPVATNDPPTAVVPVAITTLPLAIVNESKKVIFGSVIVNVPEPTKLTLYISEELAVNDAVEVDIMMISDVLCVIVPARLTKFPPTAKLPLGRVKPPEVIKTKPVLVALVSVIFQLPEPLNVSDETDELLNLTVLPAPELLNTNGLPLLLKLPPVTLKAEPMVVVPVTKVTDPFD